MRYYVFKYQNNCGVREISRSCGVGRGTVGNYLHRAKAAELAWPLSGGMHFTGMAATLDEQMQMDAFEDMTFEERSGLLLDREQVVRETRRIKTRYSFAG